MLIHAMIQESLLYGLHTTKRLETRYRLHVYYEYDFPPRNQQLATALEHPPGEGARIAPVLEYGPGITVIALLCIL